MAVLSEDDRKLILGKEWKPLALEEGERRGSPLTRTLLAVAVAIIAGAAALAWRLL